MLDPGIIRGGVRATGTCRGDAFLADRDLFSCEADVALTHAVHAGDLGARSTEVALNTSDQRYISQRRR
jgi:hypothetical protein